jgi:hypothetical protein
MGVTMVASWVGDGGKSVDEAKDPEDETKRTLMLREWGRVVFEGWGWSGWALEVRIGVQRWME